MLKAYWGGTLFIFDQNIWLFSSQVKAIKFQSQVCHILKQFFFLSKRPKLSISVFFTFYIRFLHSLPCSWNNKPNTKVNILNVMIKMFEIKKIFEVKYACNKSLCGSKCKTDYVFFFIALWIKWLWCYKVNLLWLSTSVLDYGYDNYCVFRLS